MTSGVKFLDLRPTVPPSNTVDSSTSMFLLHLTESIYIYIHMYKSIHMYIYIYADPKAITLGTKP